MPYTSFGLETGHHVFLTGKHNNIISSPVRFLHLKTWLSATEQEKKSTETTWEFKDEVTDVQPTTSWAAYVGCAVKNSL